MLNTRTDWRAVKVFAQGYIDDELPGQLASVRLYNDNSDQEIEGVEIAVRVRSDVRMSVQVGVNSKSGPYQQCWITGADMGMASLPDFDETLRDIARVGEKLQELAERLLNHYYEAAAL
jgi:hypothetical protein